MPTVLTINHLAFLLLPLPRLRRHAAFSPIRISVLVLTLPGLALRKLLPSFLARLYISFEFVLDHDIGGGHIAPHAPLTLSYTNKVGMIRPWHPLVIHDFFGQFMVQPHISQLSVVTNFFHIALKRLFKRVPLFRRHLLKPLSRFFFAHELLNCI